MEIIMANIKIKALKHKGCCFLAAVTLLTGISSSEAIAGKINEEEDHRIARKRQEAKTAIERPRKLEEENRKRQVSAVPDDNMLENAKKLKEEMKRKHERKKETQQSINRAGFRILGKFMDKFMGWLD